MPTYDYRCNACGHEFELFQSMSDPVKKKCPECSKLALERLIGAGAAVLFKGGGFYETDYRSESYKKAADAEKKTASTDKKSDAKTESKPAKKAEPASKPDASKTGGK
jgi:putative FmdB family regulatory protein